MSKKSNVVKVKSFADVVYHTREAQRQGKKIDKFVAASIQCYQKMRADDTTGMISIREDGEYLCGIPFSFLG